MWRALGRLGCWVEPVLVAEWARLMRGYGERMGRALAPGTAEAVLVWLDPAQDTALARHVAGRLLARGETLRCVWTGAPLREGALDVDHCLPWSAWPCDDLWNLLPASPRVNRDLKCDRLPSAETLGAARPAITAWWERAWLADAALGPRFRREAAALAVASDPGAEPTPAEAFDGLAWRRLRLRQDQQVAEWTHAEGRAAGGG